MSISLNGKAPEVCELIAKSVQKDLASHLEAILLQDAKSVIRKLAEDLAKQIMFKMEVDVNWRDPMMAAPTINLFFNDKQDTKFKVEQTVVKNEGVLDASK